MGTCQQNLHHAQKLQKQAHDKVVKPQSYVPGDKVWLSSKHLKNKRNCKLEAKFLGPFRVLHLVSKQAYKLKLPKNRGCITYFMYHCWNKIPRRRGKWMTYSWNLRLATTRNMRSIAFGTAWSMPGSQQNSYQGSTIWPCGKVTLRSRIPGSLHWQSSTFKSLWPSITKTIQKSW